MHTASPYALIVNDSQKDLVDPAVRGTLTVLESCKKFPSIKKVILTSSVAAITDSPISGKKYTENDWNLVMIYLFIFFLFFFYFYFFIFFIFSIYLFIYLY